MRIEEALNALETAGTAQNRKVYARHGVKGPCHGVSFAELRKLAKTLGRDPSLAEALWESGNHDARVLATMVCEPAAMTSRDFDRWARDLDNYILADALSQAVAASPLAAAKMESWRRRKGEFVGQAGWNLVAQLALKELPEDRCAALAGEIEAGIHGAANRVRHAMNMALIAIGTRSPALRRTAEAAARRIGPVEVDHGETGCTTPAVLPYLERAWARKRGKAKG